MEHDDWTIHEPAKIPEWSWKVLAWRFAQGSAWGTGFFLFLQFLIWTRIDPR